MKLSLGLLNEANDAIQAAEDTLRKGRVKYDRLRDLAGLLHDRQREVAGEIQYNRDEQKVERLKVSGLGDVVSSAIKDRDEIKKALIERLAVHKLTLTRTEQVTRTVTTRKPDADEDDSSDDAFESTEVTEAKEVEEEVTVATAAKREGLSIYEYGLHYKLIE